MSNKKIKRVIYVTEFPPKETRHLNKLVKLTGTSKSVILRALARTALDKFKAPTTEELLVLTRRGKF